MRLGASAVSEAVLSTCALIALGLLLGRWVTTPAASDATEAPAPVLDARAREALAEGGQRIGAPDAARTLVVFSDFQCPFCAELAAAFRQAERSSRGRLAMLFRHLPLSSIHPHAEAAAAAAECAAEQGRFGAYHDALFAVQASIGQLSWDSIAALAGVPDRQAFRECEQSSRYRDRVAADLELASRLGLDGTPSVFLDGRPVTGPFTPDRLLELLGEQ